MNKSATELSPDQRAQLEVAINSGDDTSIREALRSIASVTRISVAEPLRVGRSLGRDVLVTGEWGTPSLFREIIANRLDPLEDIDPALPVVWVGLAADAQAPSSFPEGYFLHVKGDEFYVSLSESAIGDTRAAEHLLTLCARGVPSSVQDFWNKELASILRDQARNPLGALVAAEHVSAKHMAGHSTAIQIELPSAIARALGTRVAEMFRQTVKLKEDPCATGVEAMSEKSELAFDYLIAALVSRAAQSQHVGDPAVSRLSGSKSAPPVKIGMLFPHQSDAYAYRFDDGAAGWALVLRPGDGVRFPYVGLPLPKVSTVTGLVVVAHCGADGEFTMARATFDDNISDLLAATPAETSTRIMAMFTLMRARQSLLRAASEAPGS